MKSVWLIMCAPYLTVFSWKSVLRETEKCTDRNGERERESGKGNTVCGSTETVNIYGIAGGSYMQDGNAVRWASALPAWLPLWHIEAIPAATCPTYIRFHLTFFLPFFPLFLVLLLLLHSSIFYSVVFAPWRVLDMQTAAMHSQTFLRI